MSVQPRMHENRMPESQDCASQQMQPRTFVPDASGPRILTPRVLVIGPSWVGDMVMAQSLFIELRHRHPDVLIDVMAPAWSRPLLARMPQVYQALELPLAHGELGLSKRWQLGRTVRKQHYDQAIVLPNSFKSALIPRFAGIPRRTGWRGEMRSVLLNDCRVLDKNKLPLMVERFVALALPPDAALPDPLPVPQLRADHTQAQRTGSRFGLQTVKRTLILCPGAEFGSAKQWPAEHYAAVATAKIADGWQVVLLGSARDQATAALIRQQVNAEDCLNLAGQTTLDEAIDLLSLADAVVSNDSGLMHIAAALHRPLVALYGSTSPDFTPPLSDRVELLFNHLECRPCFKRECPLTHKRCLTELAPQRVLDALDKLQQPLLAQEANWCVS